jgi:hypothetical protein
MTDPANDPAIGPGAEPATVTYYFTNPRGGTVRLGDCTASWAVEAVTFKFLAPGQEPSDYYLRESLQRNMRDKDGNLPSMAVLTMLDLETGYREAIDRELKAAWDAVDAGQ